PMPRIITRFGALPVIMRPPMPALSPVSARSRVDRLTACAPGVAVAVALAVAVADGVVVGVAVAVALAVAVGVAVAVAVAVGPGVPVAVAVAVAVGVGVAVPPPCAVPKITMPMPWAFRPANTRASVESKLKSTRALALR